MASIRHTLQNILIGTNPRLLTTSVVISGDSYNFKKQKNGGTLTSGTSTPTNIVLTAVTSVFTSPTFSWEYKASNGGGWASAGSSNPLTITSTSYNTHRGTGTFVTYRCTATQTGWVTATSPELIINYFAEADDPITVEQTRSNVLIAASSTGVANNYLATSNILRVKRGNEYLNYGVSGANTFSVGSPSQTIITGSGTITVPAGSGSGTDYSIGDFTNMANELDSASLTYNVTVRDAQGISGTPIPSIQTVNKLKSTAAINGVNSVSVQLTNDSAIVPTDSNGNGGNYAATPTGIEVSEGTTKLTYALSGTAVGTFTISTISTSNINAGSLSGEGTTRATLGPANTITGPVASITVSINAYTTSGTVPVSVSQSISRNPSGVPGVDATAYWVSGSVASMNKSTTNVFTPASITFTGYRNVSSVTSSPAIFWFRIFENGSGTASSTSTIAEASRTYTPTSGMTSIRCEISLTSDFAVILDQEGLSVARDGTNGTPGDPGAPGASGTKSITLSSFKWANSPQSVFSSPFTLTWPASPSSQPDGTWTPSAGISPGNGYTLYQWNVIVTDTATATSTATNWNAGSIGSVGFRQDGSIGPQGAGARKAYIVMLNTNVPTTPATFSGDGVPGAAVTGSNGGTGWSTTLPTVPTSTASTTYVLWLSDGNYYPLGSPSNANSTLWGAPYLATFKVDSLQAVSANLGNVSVSSVGALFSTGKTFANTTNGFFLGYDSTAYKFQLGSSTGAGISWDGGTFTIRNSSGAAILTSGNAASDIFNSSISISGGAISGIGTGNNTSVANSSISVSGGTINGIGTGNGTAVANSSISISGGAISGIGTGDGTSVANSLISISNAGVLTGGGASGTVTAGGINALLKNAPDTITGEINLAVPSALYIGSASTGLYLGSTGLYAKNGGVTKFSIDSSGNALFAGTLAAGVSITSPVITGGTITGSTIQTGTSPSKRVEIDSANATLKLFNAGASPTNTVDMNAENGTIFITSTSSLGGILNVASTGGGGVALTVSRANQGLQSAGFSGYITVNTDGAVAPIVTNSSVMCTNLNAGKLGGVAASGFTQINMANLPSGAALQQITTGAGVATFGSTNKPGASSTNTWLVVTINGTNYSIPVWSN